MIREVPGRKKEGGAQEEAVIKCGRGTGPPQEEREPK